MQRAVQQCRRSVNTVDSERRFHQGIIEWVVLLFLFWTLCLEGRTIADWWRSSRSIQIVDRAMLGCKSERSTKARNFALFVLMWNSILWCSADIAAGKLDEMINALDAADIPAPNLMMTAPKSYDFSWAKINFTDTQTVKWIVFFFSNFLPFTCCCCCFLIENEK